MAVVPELLNRQEQIHFEFTTSYIKVTTDYQERVIIARLYLLWSPKQILVATLTLRGRSERIFTHVTWWGMVPTCLPR